MVNQPIGDVKFDTVSVSGQYGKTMVIVQGYNDLGALDLHGLSLAAGATAGWTALYIDPTQGADLSHFPTASDGTTNVSLDGVTIGSGSFGWGIPNLVNGGYASDVLVGSSGADNLVGGTGNDTITGGNGNDTITGSAGADTITGGLGADVVNYKEFGAYPAYITFAQEVANTGVVATGVIDVITDFVAGTDTIDFVLPGAGKFLADVVGTPVGTYALALAAADAAFTADVVVGGGVAYSLQAYGSAAAWTAVLFIDSDQALGGTADGAIQIGLVGAYATEAAALAAIAAAGIV